MPQVTNVDVDEHHPDRLMPPVSRECAPLYWSAVESGERIAEAADVTIVGLARNSMPWMRMNRDRVHALASNFEAWRCFVYENDSTDGTDDCLRKWAEEVSCVEVCCVKHDRPQLSSSKGSDRTNALAEYRAACQEWARSYESKTDYVIVIDFDTWAGWSDSGVMTSLHWLKHNPQAAGMASVSTIDYPVAQAQRTLRIHYDAWAFRMNHWTEHGMGWFPHWFPVVGSDPIRVHSAFGGLCVYRPEAYFAGTYAGGDCEHVRFHHSIAKAGRWSMYLNPSSRVVMNWTPSEASDGGRNDND
jgi:hypothetical protein